MFRQFLSVIILIHFNTITLHAQSMIEGIIADKTDQQLLQGALVQLVPSGSAVLSDSNGHYRLSPVQQGDYQLEVSRMGYIKTTYTVHAGKGVVIRNLQLERNVLDLAAITVRADKSRMASVIPAIDMRLQPVRTAQDLLRTVPGLFIAQHAGGGKAEQIFLRGTDNDHGTDFGIFMDGIPINLPNHAHGQGYADMHFIIPEMIGSAAYYKGPYEAELGDFTNTGAAVYQSVYNPDRSFLKLETGQFNTKRIVGLLSIPQRLHLFGKHTNENAYIASEYTYTNGYFNDPQQYKRLNLLSRYNIQLDSRNRLSLIVSTFHSNWNASGQIPQRAVDKGLIDRLGSLDSTEGGNTARTNVNLNLSTRINDHTELHNQVYYSRYDFRLYSNFTFFADDPVQGDEIKQWEQRNLLGYNGSLKYRFTAGSIQSTTEAGVTARMDFIHLGRDHVHYRGFLSNEDSAVARVMNYSFYINQTWKWRRHWTLNIGLRNDLFLFHNEDFINAQNSGNAAVYRFSPKLSVFYDVSEHVALFVKSGMGFHSNYANTAIVNGNNNAVPRSYGSDIGTIFKIRNRAYISAVAWWLQSGAEYRFSADNGSYEDIGRSVRTGIEISGRYNIWRSLWADVNLDAARPRLKDAPDTANRIPMAPLFTSTGGVSYQAAKGWSCALRYRYMGGRPAIENNSVRASAYTVFDAVLQYAFSRWELGLSAENLFGVKWREAQFYDASQLKGEAAPVLDFHYTPGTPFLIKGSIVVRF